MRKFHLDPINLFFASQLICHLGKLAVNCTLFPFMACVGDSELIKLELIKFGVNQVNITAYNILMLAFLPGRIIYIVSLSFEFSEVIVCSLILMSRQVAT